MKTEEELRPYLFAIAYRMLGSVADAEDVVQDAFLRYEEAQVDPDSPKAYLATVTTRLVIDELRSARARREVYPGEWLPEPFVEDDEVRHAEMADSLSLTFLHLLEKLSPVERAVFLLREVFDYPYETSPRSWASRRPPGARSSFVPMRTSTRAASASRCRARNARRSRSASSPLGRTGTPTGSSRCSLPTSRYTATAAGRRRPSRRRSSAPSVAKALIGWGPRLAAERGYSYRPSMIHGEPGLVFYGPDGSVAGVEAFEIADGLIVAIRTVLNPDKLSHVPAR